MTVITIHPETIGASGEWSDDWKKFISALGWKEGDKIWTCAYVINVEVK